MCISQSASATLLLNRALLGEVSARLRGVQFKLAEFRLDIQFYFDGEITFDDRYSASCVTGEVAAGYPGDFEVAEEIIRLDAPQNIPGGATWHRVYERKESKEWAMAP